MKKNKHFKAVALLICMLFNFCVFSFTNAAEKKITKTNYQTEMKSSMRILGFIFPMLSAFTGKPQNVTTNKGKIIDNNMRLIMMPAVEASSNTPKTKD